MPRKNRNAQPQAADSRALLDGQVSESQLQRDVLELAARLGYFANHTYDSRKSGPDAGFPDLILAKDGRVLAIELKTERGRLSIAQLSWSMALMGAVEFYVWRPRDLSSGKVERVLLGERGEKVA